MTARFTTLRALFSLHIKLFQVEATAFSSVEDVLSDKIDVMIDCTDRATSMYRSFLVGADVQFVFSAPT